MAGFMNFMIFVFLAVMLTLWAATGDPSWFLSPLIVAVTWGSSGLMVDWMTGSISSDLTTFRQTVAFEPGGGGWEVSSDKGGGYDRGDSGDDDFLY